MKIRADNSPRMRGSLRSFVRLPVLAALCVLLSCGTGSKEVTLQAKDEGGNPVPGIEIYLVGGKEESIARTDDQGQATLTARKKDQFRLVPPSEGDEALYQIDDPPDGIYTVAESDLESRLAYVWLKRIRTVVTEETATLRIVSVPEGAQVSVNGQAIGTTPVTLADLTPGTITIELRLDGHKPAIHELFLLAGETADTVLLHPEEVVRGTTGTLRVASEPSGATIHLDHEDTGRTTAAVFEGLGKGAHHLRLEKEGFEPLETIVRVVPGEERSVRPRLAPKGSPKSEGPSRKTTFWISTSPRYAKVFIDGDPTNRNLTNHDAVLLAPGPHEFRVVRPDGQSVVLKLTVREGDRPRGLILDYEVGRVLPGAEE